MSESVNTLSFKYALKNILIEWKCMDCDFEFIDGIKRKKCPACKSDYLGGKNVSIGEKGEIIISPITQKQNKAETLSFD